MRSGTHSPLAQELQAVGFSALEADVYIALTQSGRPMTGYEVAKTLEVARANVYDALRQLHRLGVVWKRPGADATRYLPVPFTQVAARARSHLDARLARIAAELRPTPLPAGLWQASGWDSFVEQVRDRLERAESDVAIGASHALAGRLRPLFGPRPQAALRFRFGCWDGCPETGCGACLAPVASLPPIAAEDPTVVIIDRRHAVMTAGHGAEALVVSTDYVPVVEGLLRLLSPVYGARGSGSATIHPDSSATGADGPDPRPNAGRLP